MASAFTHAAAAPALGAAFRDAGPPARFWVLGAVCAVFPDVDVIGYHLGIPYGSVLGHRGITHSILFAALMAGAAVMFLPRASSGERRRMWMFFWLAGCSHGVLDAMTRGGGGIAFFAPVDNTRYSLPWKVIEVSPLSVSRFFTARGVEIMESEALWVWIPATVFALACLMIRRTRHIRLAELTDRHSRRIS